jgi:poly-gamma-glutamate capsule biosynthesis protein CapA/YwtB (metallophosphatase superfamily)
MGEPSIPDQNCLSSAIRLFVCGDVMIGRGIDQILPAPCRPNLYEACLRSALEYKWLAEGVNGKIPAPVTMDYVWGAALDEFSIRAPDAKLINLETSITRSEDYALKGINYRVSPENAECLRAAGIDCCSLANNHVMDWGRQGLEDTLSALRRLHIACAGAGSTLGEAASPAVIPVPGKGRALFVALALPTSGVPDAWAATVDTPGVNYIPDLSDESASGIINVLDSVRMPGDVGVASIHWGGNWGYEVLDQQRDFAHRLIDDAKVSVVHGHSSHHPKPIEIYKNRVILYGCGDFLNDYEGISGRADYRGDLVLMYFIDVDARSGDVRALSLVPLRIVRFRLERASSADATWLLNRLQCLCEPFGVHLKLEGSTIVVNWRDQGAT